MLVGFCFVLCRLFHACVVWLILLAIILTNVRHSVLYLIVSLIALFTCNEKIDEVQMKARGKKDYQMMIMMRRKEDKQV